MKKLLLVLVVLLTASFVFGARTFVVGASSDSDMLSTPLTIEFPADGDGGFITIVNIPSGGMWYSINDGDRIQLAVENDAIIAQSGDRVSLYANIGFSHYYSAYQDHMNILCSSYCYIYGNIMSLIQSMSFENLTEVPAYAFTGLFKKNSQIHNHSTKDIVLPATTLDVACYKDMFYACTGLTQAPELPATTLAYSCYANMFEGCTSLTKAPELSATTLDWNCYAEMFNGCTSLTQAPALPAETLAESCYQGMFYGCTSLTEAPDLPAMVLVEDCYSYMFFGCSSLRSVTCLAVNPSSNSTYFWTFEIPYYGTFTKRKGINWPIGDNGIPSGWTVVEL